MMCLIKGLSGSHRTTTNAGSVEVQYTQNFSANRKVYVHISNARN